MFNEFRTLLRNRTGLDVGGSDSPGSRLVPATFRRRKLSTDVSRVWTTVFGDDPDTLGMNFRLWEIARLVGASDLSGDVVRNDPRLSYAITDPDPVWGFGADWHGRAAETHVVHPAETVGGPSGRILQVFRVDVAVPNTTVSRAHPARTQLQTTSVAGDWTTPISLPGTLLRVRFAAAAVGTRFSLDLRTMPPTLGDKSATILQAVQAVRGGFFPGDDPYVVRWRQMFGQDRNTVNQLAAVLLMLSSHIAASPVAAEA